MKKKQSAVSSQRSANLPFKLGKLPFKADKRDFMFAKYRAGAPLPPHPAQFGHEQLVTNWGMLGNDQVGDCAIAGPMHMIMLWRAASGRPCTFTTENAIAAYSAISGYNPNRPNSDAGCQMRSVLNYWRQTGFKDAAGNVHKIGAYLNIPLGDVNSLIEALWLFGAVNAGLLVPRSIYAQFQAGQSLAVVKGSPIIGGHCLPFVGQRANIVGCTWGSVIPITAPFRQKYYDEYWAVISEDELNGQGVSPEGFNWPQLQADLAAL